MKKVFLIIVSICGCYAHSLAQPDPNYIPPHSKQGNTNSIAYTPPLPPPPIPVDGGIGVITRGRNWVWRY